MITGAHWLLYSKDPEADRAFFRDVLGFPAVDAGGGWLILGLPPAELGVHPGTGEFSYTSARGLLRSYTGYILMPRAAVPRLLFVANCLLLTGIFAFGARETLRSKKKSAPKPQLVSSAASPGHGE